MKNQYRFSLFALILFSLLLSSSPPSAAGEVRPPLRIGIMSLEPYGFKDEAGDWTGNLFEIAHEILKESPFEGSVEVLPIARLVKEAVETGRVDCSIFIASEFIETNMVRVAALDQTLNSGILPRSHIRLETYEDLEDVRIGVSLGIRIHDRFDNDDSLNKIQVRDYNNAIMMLDRGRVDAVAGVIESLKFSAQKAGLNTPYGKPLIFKTLGVYFYCGHKSPILKYRESLQNTLAELIAAGTIEKIMARYR